MLWNSGTEETGVPVCCKPPEWVLELEANTGRETPYPTGAQRWEEC